MQLSDRDISALVVDFKMIEPFDESQLQPATYDMRLGVELRCFNHFYTDRKTPIIPGEPEEDQTYVRAIGSIPRWRYTLEPGEFILGSTIERVHLPPHIAGRIEGKSGLGRIGLLVHSTAGFIDPGFDGVLTLEMTNINARPITLSAGMPICQVSFTTMTSRARHPYGSPSLGSHYQHSDTTEQAR